MSAASVAGSSSTMGGAPEKYKRVGLLGSGSFGKAYLCEVTGTDRHVVIKQMETNMMQPHEREEAVREAHLLRAFSHPNVVKFHEAFMTKRGRLCIVMDYADGGDLNTLIKSRNGELIPEPQILSLFVQLCLGLKHVHDKKVLHRDLKSKNVFICMNGVVQLGDFGIAKVLEATKDYAKTMVGTPYYLSPEIVSERPYSFKSDVWSLGVLLYELTTLRHPFDAESLHTLAIKIVKGTYPAPDLRYSPQLVGLIKAMLNRDPDRRPNLQEVLHLPWLRPYVDSACQHVGREPEQDLGAYPVGSKFLQEQSQISPNRAVSTPQPAAQQAPPPRAAAPGPSAAAPGPPLPGGPGPAFGRTMQAGPPLPGGPKGPGPALNMTGTAARLGGGGAGGVPDPKSMFYYDASANPGKLDRRIGEATNAPGHDSDGEEDSPALASRFSNAIRIGGGIEGQSATQQLKKAENLRAYLKSELTADEFDIAYKMVRELADSPEQERQSVATHLKELIGPAKTAKVTEMLQLLVFLEDMAGFKAAENA